MALRRENLASAIVGLVISKDPDFGAAMSHRSLKQEAMELIEGQEEDYARALKMVKKLEKVKRKPQAMKVMKKVRRKRVSVIAKGKRARAEVLAGRKIKTKTGMTKEDLTKNIKGKTVSRKASDNGKRQFQGKIGEWTACVMRARKLLSLKGMVAVNGKTPEGRALYAKAKSFYSK
jgi:hypothetical protein